MYGRTYEEWSARWWQWVFAIPAPNNPLLDTIGKNAYFGQSERVFFLAGAFCVQSPTPSNCQHNQVTRYVIIPRGKPIFFPVANSWADSIGVDPLPSEEAVAMWAKEGQDGATDLKASVDGYEIQHLNNAPPFRVASPVSSYQLPANNLLKATLPPEYAPLLGPQRVPRAASNGVYVMLAPLAPGSHIIKFSAKFPNDFSLDIKYHIWVI